MRSHRKGAGTSERHQRHRGGTGSLADAVTMPGDRVVSGPIKICADGRKTGLKCIFERHGDHRERMARIERPGLDGADQSWHRHHSVIHRAFHGSPRKFIAQLLEDDIAASKPPRLKGHRRPIVEGLRRGGDIGTDHFARAEQRRLHCNLQVCALTAMDLTGIDSGEHHDEHHRTLVRLGGAGCIADTVST